MLLASSASSSSEIMQRFISLLIGERGSILLKYSVKESVLSSSPSLRPKVFTRRAVSNTLLTSRSSVCDKVLPTSRRFIEAPISFVPEKDKEPLCQSLDKASEVSFCSFERYFKLVTGSKASQRAFPFGEEA